MIPKVDPRTGKALGGRRRAFPSHVIAEPSSEEELPLSTELDPASSPPPAEAFLLDAPPAIPEPVPIVIDKVEYVSKRSRRSKQKKAE